jgi:hypothetical protein
MYPHHRSPVRRVLIMVLTVGLVTHVFTSAPLALSAAHADSISGCIALEDNSPSQIVQGCALGPDFHNAVEQPVIDELLQTYNLPSSDSSRLLGWQRNLVRAAVFAKLLSIIKTPASSRTTEEQTAVDDLAGLVKAQRVLAAQDAQNEYNTWNASPCTYNPPGPYAGTYDTSVCGTIAGIFGLQPPTLADFENYGSYQANSDYATNAGLSLVSAQAASGLGLLGGAAVGAGAGAGISFLPAASVGGLVDAIFPYAIAGEEVAADGGILAGPVGILILAATADILALIDLAEDLELPTQLAQAVTSAQNTPINLASLVQSKAGLQEVYGAFIRTTMNGYGSFSGLAAADFQPSTPAPAFNPADRKFEIVDSSGGTPTQTGQLTYLDWAGHQQTAWLDGGWFVVEDSNGNLNLSLSIDVQMDVQGKSFKYTVERDGDNFLLVGADGDTSYGLGIGLDPNNFPYKDWTGHVNYASLAPPDGTPPWIDATAVTTDGAGDTVPYDFGTTATEPVTITFTCNDADGPSDVAVCPAPVTFAGPIDTTFHVQAMDWSGNVENNTFSVIVMPNGYQPPTISAGATTPDGKPYIAGTWTNRTVTVHFTCQNDSDPVTGIQSCPSDQQFSDEGTSSASGQVVANSGFSNDTTFGPIKIDTTPPSIALASVTTADGQTYTAGTWTNQPVTLHYTCSDDLSGIAAGGCPDQTFGEVPGGETYAAGTATDNAGNTAMTASFGPIRVDQTPPTVACSSPAPTFVYGQAGTTVSATVSDATSGPKGGQPGGTTTISVPAPTGTVGSSSVSLTGHDNAGNSATVGCAYTVNKANTGTTVSSSNSAVTHGQSVTFTAPVAAVSPGSGTPTGTVTFHDGSAVLGTGQLNASTPDQASFSTGGLSVGPHVITASYGGDGNFISSTSSTLTQYINTDLSRYPTLSGGAYNLSNANLSGSYLVNVNLAGANLSSANFKNSVLIGANLTRANLSNGNFSGANFSGANLSGANLTNINLKGATGLSTATLTGTTWNKTLCPDGTGSNADGGTCVGHL